MRLRAPSDPLENDFFFEGGILFQKFPSDFFGFLFWHSPAVSPPPTATFHSSRSSTRTSTKPANNTIPTDK